MTSTPDNNGAFGGFVAVRPKAGIERDELRKLVAQYTDELLKRAIIAGVTEKDEPTEPDEEYRKLMNSILPRPSKILEGINLLYMTDIDRANARMQQTAPYIHEEVRAVLREAEYASKPIPAYTQVYQRSEYPDWVNVGGRYIDGTLARTQLLKSQMENIQVQINQNMINAINARNDAAQTFWRWS